MNRERQLQCAKCALCLCPGTMAKLSTGKTEIVFEDEGHKKEHSYIVPYILTADR